MRSYNNLYEPMLHDDYIRKCFKDAAKGKTKRNDVQKILENLDAEVGILKEILQREMFVPDFHKKCVINENNCHKTRRILKPNYKYEQVVHHCAIGQFKPIVLKGLYDFSCGSIPGRGVHYGKKYMKKWIESYDGKKLYVLKMDIHHFFESIDRTILKKKLREVIRDGRFYRLMCVLVEYDRTAETIKILEDVSTEMSEDEVRSLVSCIAFDDDAGALEVLQGAGVSGATFEATRDVICDRRKGVPLGYFTSQWFGNFYLKKLDHYIKQELKVDHNMRYVDDMVILGRNKKKLHAVRRAIAEYLEKELKLELKKDWQVFRFEYVAKDGSVRGRMLDYMGFQFHHDRITMRKSTIQRARIKAYRIKAKEKITWYDAAAMLSYMGWFKHTDTYDYYLRYIKPCVNVKKLKKIVSKHQRKENERERLAQGNRDTGNETGGDRPDIVKNDGVSAEEYQADRAGEHGRRQCKSVGV